MIELKQLKGGGNCTIQIAPDKPIYHYAFQIFDGKFILCPSKPTIIMKDGIEHVFDLHTFLSNDQISVLNNKWTRFQDYDKRRVYDIFLRHNSDCTFDIIHFKDDCQHGDNPDDIKIDTILFFSPTINRFYIDNKNITIYKKVRPLKGWFDYSGFREKLFTIELTTSNETKKIVNVGFPFWMKKQYIFSSLHENSTPVQISTPLCFFIEDGQILTLEDIEKLTIMVNNFLSFICFEKIENITEVMLSGLEKSGQRVLPNFYTHCNFDFKKETRTIINYSELKAAGVQAIMQDLLNQKIDTGLIFPLQQDMVFSIDILRHCAAIEYEVGLCDDYMKTKDSIRKNIDYDELHKLLQAHRKKIAKGSKSEFDSAVTVFEKFDGSLVSKLKFAHYKLLSCFTKKVELNGWMYITNIDRICDRVKHLRNGLAHGLREDKHRTWYARDIQLLQAIIYMLILTRNKINKKSVRQILGKIIDDLWDLRSFELYKKNNEQGDKNNG